MLLSKTITDFLNKQLVHEGKNHLKYMAMSAYFSESNLTGFEKLFLDQAKGERDHYDRIYKYMSDKNAKITIDSIPGADFSGGDMLTTCKNVAKQFYDVEIGTTQKLYEIYDKAQSEKDFGTCRFLFDFLIPEQVEEEALALNIKAEIDRCSTTGDLNNMDARLKG
jgi:ferritin